MALSLNWVNIWLIWNIIFKRPFQAYRLKWPSRLLFILFNQSCSLNHLFFVTLSLCLVYLNDLIWYISTWKCGLEGNTCNCHHVLMTAIPMQWLLIKVYQTVMMAITQNYGLHHWSKLENWQGKMQRGARYLNTRLLQDCATDILDKRQPIIA